VIRLREIFCGYPGNDVLRGIDLDINCGELLCIIGKNGCGKTTLVKTASGLLKPKSGDIFCDDDALFSLTSKERGKRIAYLAQGNKAPDMTVFEAVLHGRFPYLSYFSRYSDEDREKALLAMERLSILDHRNRQVLELSGGMRQRVYIAMALCQGASHILLDEPSTYLDIDGQLELMGLLRSLAKEGKAVAAVTHDLTMAFTHADKLALVDRGVISVYGTPEQVSASEALKQIFSVSVTACDDGIYRYKY